MIKAVPYLTKTVVNPWSDIEEKKYTGCETNYDEVVFIPSIHARLLLLDDNIYLCSIKNSENLYRNFHLIPYKRGSFYIHAHIPQLSILYKLYLTNSDANKIPKDSLFYDLYTHLATLINDYYTYDEDNDVYIIGDQILILVNAPITDWFYRFSPGIYNPEIKGKLGLLNDIYNRIVSDYRSLINNEYIRKQLFIYKAKKFAKKLLIKAITIGVFKLTVDYLSDWSSIPDVNMDYTYDGSLDPTENYSGNSDLNNNYGDGSDTDSEITDPLSFHSKPSKSEIQSKIKTVENEISHCESVMRDKSQFLSSNSNAKREQMIRDIKSLNNEIKRLKDKKKALENLL